MASCEATCRAVAEARRIYEQYRRDLEVKHELARIYESNGTPAVALAQAGQRAFDFSGGDDANC
jgi:hypothetical protein